MTRAPLETERLVLEPVPVELARAIVAGKVSALRPAKGWPHTDTLDAMRAAVSADSDAPWLVRLKATGEVIGDCGWMGPPDATGTAEIGYGLAGPWRGRGYGTEAVRALVDWALAQPGCKQLTAEVQQDNLPSRRLLERLEFVVDRVEGAYVWYVRQNLLRGRTRTRPRT
jgi:ribosomal-protein-alanine N-acetyltransferase